MALPELLASVVGVLWLFIFICNVCATRGISGIKKGALCEIQWVIKFHFSTEKINHVDKVMDIAVTPGASFG